MKSRKIILKVKGDGLIVDESGADFVIYENPFIIGPLVYQEFAHVGVASENRASSYRWFRCNPEANILVGCAGVVPTKSGGDRFDLKSVGLKKVRFIKIKDTGWNFENYDENTEGFDLDSIDLLNAFELGDADD